MCQFINAQSVKDCPDSMFYRYDNVITLRTFSKVYGLAGFRLGYGFGHENLISNLMKVKLPFEPSFPAQIAGISALKDDEYIIKSISLNNDGRKYLSYELSLLGFKFIPSVTNFITIKFKMELEALHFVEEMLKRGIIIRPLVGFGWPECVRITIGTMDQNIFFIKTLKEIKEEFHGISIN